MKKNELINKTLAGLMIAAMTAGVCPTTAFAVMGGQVAKDDISFVMLGTVPREQ